jgi:hypothetical protein
MLIVKYANLESDSIFAKICKSGIEVLNHRKQRKFHAKTGGKQRRKKITSILCFLCLYYRTYFLVFALRPLRFLAFLAIQKSPEQKR